ncbi:hypothetical protein QP028_13485 [Corynebacterium suedekumii]|nr:hypothetical protein QP028_13485 [Corynebacterium suedekumii]
MTISLTMKKTITALALAAPLALVACGSDDGADETTSSAPSTVTSTRTSETTTTETSEEETTSSSAAPSETSAEPTEGDTEDPQAAPQINDPLRRRPARLRGGHPGRGWRPGQRGRPRGDRGPGGRHLPVADASTSSSVTCRRTPAARSSRPTAVPPPSTWGTSRTCR